MKVDDLVQAFERCGLATKEASAFVNLVRLGETKVTDLANASGLKRTEAYHVLSSLQSRGLVEATLSRPRTFRAIDPERALELLTEERASEIRSIEKETPDLLKGLEALRGDVIETSGHRFRTLHGPKQIQGQLTRSLQAATREVCVVAPSRALERLATDGFDDELKAAAERGVAVRVLTEVSDVDVAGRLASWGEVRHGRVPRPVRFVLVDDHEILTYLVADALGQPNVGPETALWVGSPDHVLAQRAFFDELWGESVNLQARIKELQTGQSAHQVGVVKGRLTRTEKIKEVLLRAKDRFDLVLAEGEGKVAQRTGLTFLLANRAGDGVRVRVICANDADRTALNLKGDVEVIVATEPVWPRFAIADSREAVVAFSAPVDPEPGSTGQEWGLWLALPNEAAPLATFFDTMWDRDSSAGPA